MQPTILVVEPEKEYELLDSGEGEKLERYGDVRLSRPDPQAIWKKSLAPAAWAKAEAAFSRAAEKGSRETGWKIKSGTPERWPVSFAGLSFWIRPTPFKHTGLFPEQAANWEWLSKIISQHSALEKGERKPVTVLNLFGYTGGATLAAAKAGAAVVHVDGSRAAVTWARENAELNGLADRPIRWIIDDVLTFVKRESKRGRKYDGIIMDPPAFGRGPKGEVWKIEHDFAELLELAKGVLSPEPLFMLVNGYASGYSAVAYATCLNEMMAGKDGVCAAGELAIRESAGRILPAGIFARWTSGPKIG